MKIIVTSVGTRGDMEPLLAVGDIMRKKGHEVICLFPEQFRRLAEDSGFKFASLGSAYIEMLESPEGQIAMGGGSFGFRKMGAYIKLIKRQGPVNKQMIRLQEEVIEREQPDRVAHNGKVIYPVIWSLSNPNKAILISPVPYIHYVKDHAHVAFNKDFGPFINKLTYKLANYGLVKTIMGSVKWLNNSRKLKQKQIQSALFSNPAIYTISPTLFTRPDYWEDQIQVLGYHERDKTVNWNPDEALLNFLADHPRVILVTFGSMINDNPPEKTRIILEVLERNRIPAIINTSAGGLVKPASYNQELFHFVERIPYDWIFPKMYAVIHHGGSGTTHMALKYGCANLIIPHIIDQYIWNEVVHEKGVGPLGKDVSQLSAKSLEATVLDLLNNPAYKTTAETLGKQMQGEDLREVVHTAMTREY
ncbi:MAG: glycosyltransferase [Bacteroidota bacterium]